MLCLVWLLSVLRAVCGVLRRYLSRPMIVNLRYKFAQLRAVLATNPRTAPSQVLSRHHCRHLHLRSREQAAVLHAGVLQPSQCDEEGRTWDLLVMRGYCFAAGLTQTHRRRPSCCPSGRTARLLRQKKRKKSELAAACRQNPHLIRLPSLSLGGLAGHHHIGKSP